MFWFINKMPIWVDANCSKGENMKTLCSQKIRVNMKTHSIQSKSKHRLCMLHVYNAVSSVKSGYSSAHSVEWLAQN